MQNKFIFERRENIDNVVKELDVVNLIENQRRYDIDVMLFNLQKEKTKDDAKMQKYMDEKQIMLSNEEE